MYCTIIFILSIVLRVGVAGGTSYWLVTQMSHIDKEMK